MFTARILQNAMYCLSAHCHRTEQPVNHKTQQKFKAAVLFSTLTRFYYLCLANKLQLVKGTTTYVLSTTSTLKRYYLSLADNLTLKRLFYLFLTNILSSYKALLSMSCQNQLLKGSITYALPTTSTLKRYYYLCLANISS